LGDQPTDEQQSKSDFDGGLGKRQQKKQHIEAVFLKEPTDAPTTHQSAFMMPVVTTFQVTPRGSQQRWMSQRSSGLRWSSLTSMR